MLNLMAVKLLLGNEVFEAPASRRKAKQELARHGFPSRSLGTSQKFDKVALIPGLRLPDDAPLLPGHISHFPPLTKVQP